MKLCHHLTLKHTVRLLAFFAGAFLLELMHGLTGTKKLFELLTFIINVMKYNAVYLKEEAVAGILRCVCGWFVCMHNAYACGNRCKSPTSDSLPVTTFKQIANQWLQKEQ